VRLSRCRRSSVRTPPAAARIPLICWPSSISGVRNGDQTASFLSRFRIRSGNSSRKGLAATRRAGHNDPAGDLEDLGRTLALFLSDEDRRSPTLTARNCIDRSSSWASSTQQRAAGLSDSSSSKATAAHSRWRFCSSRALAGILQTHRSVETRKPRVAGQPPVATRCSSCDECRSAHAGRPVCCRCSKAGTSIRRVETVAWRVKQASRRSRPLSRQTTLSAGPARCPLSVTARDGAFRAC
jgi:hypothetical protein